MSTTSTTFTYSNHIVVDASTNVDISCHHIHCSSYIGEIKIWYSESSIPDGFLLCDGSLCIVSDYPELASVLGKGSDSTFNLPNFKDYFIRGRGTNNTVYSDSSEGSDTLTSDHLPEHSLSINGGGISLTEKTINYNSNSFNSSSNISAHTHNVTHNHSHNAVNFTNTTVSNKDHTHSYKVLKAAHYVNSGEHNTDNIYEWSNANANINVGGGTAIFSGMQYYRAYPANQDGNYFVRPAIWNSRNWDDIKNNELKNWNNSDINGNNTSAMKNANEPYDSNMLHSTDANTFYGGANHGYYKDENALPYNHYQHSHELYNGLIAPSSNVINYIQTGTGGSHDHKFTFSNNIIDVSNTNIKINSTTNNATKNLMSINGSSIKPHTHQYTITINDNIVNRNATQANFIPKYNYVVYIIRWK